MASQKTSRVRAETVRIASTNPAGFHAAPEYIPRVGEMVHTTEGAAEVIRVLTRVTGGRLLELRLEKRPKPPFFAASHNVLIKDDVG
jgi:hypothetical protein